jgi:hypothetical protein
MDIIVLRGQGDSPGDDIVEPLLSDLNAALSRGRAELDQGALADEQQLEAALFDARLGQLVAMEDTALGTWRGKVTGLVHTVSVDEQGNLSATTQVTLRKPR